MYRMREPRDRTRLVRKAGATACVGGPVRRQDLQRDVTVEPRIAGPINFPHTASAGEALDLEHANARPGRQNPGGGRRRVATGLGGANLSAGQKPLRVTVCCQQRLHLVAQPDIVATRAGKKPAALHSGRRQSGVENHEHVLPSFGGHSR